MRKILTAEQEKIIDDLQNTYPDTILMNAKDMAILDKLEKFPQVNKSRLNKMLDKKAVQVFNDLNFLLKHLPNSYRFKILNSNNCNEFFKTVMDINTVRLSNLDNKTRDLIIHLAAQLLVYSINVLTTTMPIQFKKSLKNSIIPFVDLLTAISSYGEAKSLKDIPSIHIPALLLTEEPA